MKLKIKKSKRKGRGVFANINFKTGQTIEICPALIISNNDVCESIQNYVYASCCGKYCLLALGFGSLYNHSYNPNAKYITNKNNIKLLAIKDIKKGEEITINYNGNPKSKRKVWFDVKE